jgi:hypothetical protein
LETEQAHSRGRDAALRRPRTSLGTALPETHSWTAPRALATKTHSPFLWLNLICLDAPLVAVGWLWLFARTLRIPLQVGNCVALFLTAWLIYLADRFADSSSLKPGSPRSLRQEFCLRHREIWITTVFLVAEFDAYVIWRTTALETFLVGAVVGVLALIYLVLNHPLGLIWRSLPAKELAIGVLFSAGTLVALLPALTSTTNAFTISAIAFAALCALNCISIAGWEGGLDQVQGKVSVATRHPGVARHVGQICASLAMATFALTIACRGAALVLGCVSASALLLAWLNVSPRRIHQDQRTAFADLVLLTPFIPLILTAS